MKILIEDLKMYMDQLSSMHFHHHFHFYQHLYHHLTIYHSNHLELQLEDQNNQILNPHLQLNLLIRFYLVHRIPSQSVHLELDIHCLNLYHQQNNLHFLHKHRDKFHIPNHHRYYLSLNPFELDNI